MNIIKTIVLLLAVTTCRVSAQWNLQASQAEQNITCAHTLELSDKKTTSLIFPAVIKSVDKGSPDIFAQRARDVSNVLLVKAGKEQFEETNLTVITADGVLHEFTVNYAIDPSSLTFDMGAIDGAPPSQPGILFTAAMTEAELEKRCVEVMAKKSRLSLKKTKKYKVSLALRGIFIRDNVIFYRVRIRNSSNINYDIDFLKFFVRDDVRIKRTAFQETEADVIYAFGNTDTVKGRSEAEMVFALEKFTIPDSKHLVIEMFERGGGRHYQIKINNRQIVNAGVLR